jgi:hypothetical protein
MRHSTQSSIRRDLRNSAGEFLGVRDQDLAGDCGGAYVSFWLESAAVTVAILALPTRGQVLGKAVFRLMATVLGVTASIVIVGTFAQTEALLLLCLPSRHGSEFVSMRSA